MVAAVEGLERDQRRIVLGLRYRSLPAAAAVVTVTRQATSPRLGSRKRSGSYRTSRASGIRQRMAGATSPRS
jgi:hypothetical protein